MLKLIAAISLAGSAAVANKADNEFISKYAQTMWAAFQCDQYVTIEPKLGRGADFFDIGYGSGSVTFYLIDQNRISVGELINEDLLPREVLLLSQPRPSTEFVLGRIFEEATRKAFSKIVDSLPYGADRFEAMKNRARRLFDEEKCRFLLTE